MGDYDGVAVCYIGNFSHRHCTEVHVAAALESLGCNVTRIQEDGPSLPQMERLIVDADPDLLLYTRTWGLHPNPDAIEMFRRVEKHDVVTASFHLDLYLGLNRESTLDGDPFWSTQFVFTPDGDPVSEARFASLGIRHIWSPPAVHEPECVPGMVRPEFQHDVVFVGSYPYPHAEWAYRNQLVEWLGETYGAGFKRYGGGSTTVRNEPLNDLYASARCVVGDSLCPGFTKPRYWCVDEETEALTLQGWKRHDSMSEGDWVYTINPSSMLGEWCPVSAVNRFTVEDCKMLSVEGASHSSLTTMNHRWLSERPVGRDRTIVTEFRTSEELGRFDRIPLAAPCASLPPHPVWDDELVELVAWAWTEGCVRGDRYESVVQSQRANPGYVARIRGCLAAVFGPPADGSLAAERHHKNPAWREFTDSRGLVEFRLNRPASDLIWRLAPDHRPTPDFVTALTAAQLRLFIETSIDADGCRKGQAVTFAQKDAERLTGLEMACALAGIATNRIKSGDVWITHLKRRTRLGIVRPDALARTVEYVTYDGVVWCPTTRNGTWLARRNGSVYFTGNSDRLTETLGRGGVLVWPRIEGVAEIGFEEGVHFRGYSFGDFDELRAQINWCLDHPQEAGFMADAAQKYVRHNHSYRQRMMALLEVVLP